MTSGFPDRSKLLPLSRAAWECLKTLENGPKDRLSHNRGLWDRLIREGLVAEVYLKSPYKIDKGGNCLFYMLSDAGMARLKEKP